MRRAGTVAEADVHGKHSRYTQALLDHLHEACFSGGLGRTILGPEENIRMILAIVQQQQAEIAELSRRLAKHTEVSEQNAHARRQSV